MKFSLAVAMIPLSQLVAFAKVAEECGFSSITMPDSLFFPERGATGYPYTADDVRMWDAKTPFVDPMIAAAFMGPGTSKICFYPQVLELSSRNPLLLASQVGSVANLTGGRFGLGVGVGWAPEEFEWCGASPKDRGPRVDEMLEVLRLVLGGGMVEHHGKFFDFDRLQMSPAPIDPVPIYIGGHSAAALRRAARVGDGWTSATVSFADLQALIARIGVLRVEYGRAESPFEIQAVCADRFGLDGSLELADSGVTESIVIPWAMYGLGFDCDLEAKKDAVRRFSEEVICKF